MAQTDFNTSKTKFKHLLFHDRVLIAFMLDESYSQTRIAQELGICRSTISRKIRRGSIPQIVAGKSVLRYFAETAQSIADKSWANVGRKMKFLSCSQFIAHADKLMKEEGFSPDAVVGQAKDLELFRSEDMVCTNTLYRYIDFGMLETRNIDLPLKMSRKPITPAPESISASSARASMNGLRKSTTRPPSDTGRSTACCSRRPKRGSC